MEDDPRCWCTAVFLNQDARYFLSCTIRDHLLITSAKLADFVIPIIGEIRFSNLHKCTLHWSYIFKLHWKKCILQGAASLTGSTSDRQIHHLYVNNELLFNNSKGHITTVHHFGLHDCWTFSIY